MSTTSRGPSRRSVLQGAAAASAASVLGFPTIIPSSALGQDKQAAPSNRITLGFIGIGKMASGHLNYMTGRTDTQVVAVCDVDKVRREAAHKTVVDKYTEMQRKDYKGCEQYVDYRELLARKDIDAVVIGTPDHWHTIPIIEAAKAKKHIYCEKPLTHTILEAKTAIEAVRKHNVVFQTGSQQRSEGPFRDVVDYIRNGRLGKIKQVFIAIGQTSKPANEPEQPVPAGLEWDRWLGAAPALKYNDVYARGGKLHNTYPFNPGWRDYREFSGGHVTDWGAHHIDITQWALQMDGNGPDEFIPPEKEGDVFGAKFIYRNSPAGSEIVCTHVREIPDAPDGKNPGKTKKQGNGILFVGEKGKIFVSRGEKASDPASILAEPLSESDKKLPNTGQHRQHWLECIKGGGKERPVCDVHVGAGSVTACHLVNLTYWHNKKIQWDAKTWQFTNGTGDPKWLDKVRREGYALPDIG